MSEGYADAGYEYVIIDDCWMERERDPVTDKLVPHKERFSSGLNHLSDYVSLFLFTQFAFQVYLKIT